MDRRQRAVPKGKLGSDRNGGWYIRDRICVVLHCAMDIRAQDQRIVPIRPESDRDVAVCKRRRKLARDAINAGTIEPRDWQEARRQIRSTDSKRQLLDG